MKENGFFISARGRRASKNLPLELQMLRFHKRKHPPSSASKDPRTSTSAKAKRNSLRLWSTSSNGEKGDPDIVPTASQDDDTDSGCVFEEDLVPEDRSSQKRRQRKESEKDISTLDDDNFKKFKVEVVTKLLADFSLEETVDHYRSLYSKPYIINPADFSYDCAMAATQYRERMYHLTGTREVKANDHNYTRRLTEKMRSEYEMEMDKAETERVETERQRMRMLLAQGLVTVDDIKHDKVLYREYRAKEQWDFSLMRTEPPARRKKRRRKQGSPNRCKSASYVEERVTDVTPPQSRAGSHWPSYAHRHNRPDTTPGDVSRSSHAVRFQTRDTASHDSESRLAITASREDVSSGSSDGGHSRLGSAQSLASSTGTRKSCVSPAFVKYEHPIVRQMKAEQSVRGLYTLAEEIVPPKELRDQLRVAEDAKKKKLKDEEQEYKYNPKKGLKMR